MTTQTQRAILLVVAPSGSRFGSELAKALAAAGLRDVRVSRTTAELAGLVSSGTRFRLAVVISQTADSADTLVEFVRDTRLAMNVFFVGPSLASSNGVRVLPTPIGSDQVVSAICAEFGTPAPAGRSPIESSTVTPPPKTRTGSARVDSRVASGQPPSVPDPGRGTPNPAHVSPALAYTDETMEFPPPQETRASASSRSRAVGAVATSDTPAPDADRASRSGPVIPAHPVPEHKPARRQPTSVAGMRMSTSLDLHGPRSSKRIPRQIGDFVIERELGAGGMGMVYLGSHVTLELPVAIKLLLPGADARDVMRFYREAKVAARLDHPHIVRILSAGAWEDTHYIAMQFIDGDTMKGVLERAGPVPVNRATQLLTQALSALAHAHQRKSIHRDIKPDNMMLTKEGDLKITDFGLARSTGSDDVRLTRTGNIIGTPAYMPIEQWNGEDIDHRADLYSLGASFYQLLTGHLPYDAETRGKLVRAMLTGKYTPIRDYRPDVPPALAQTIEKLMQQDPADRPQSARDALQMLRQR